MKTHAATLGRLIGARVTLLALIAAGIPVSLWSSAETVAAAPPAGTVLQTNLVSDLPGVATDIDPHLVNPWGISESTASPFWLSDNNAGVATLYAVSPTNPISVLPLVVTIPTPPDPTGDSGTPTGTVFNLGPSGSFRVAGFNASGGATSAQALFLFATEDGTIAGWNPGVNPQNFDHNLAGKYAVIAVDNSGNNFTNPDPQQQTGAVYKGLAIAASQSPIVPDDLDSAALLYASNFRSGQIEVFDTTFHRPSSLPADAFTDPALPSGYAPFDVQVLAGKLFVTYALQDATRHDDVAGPHHGFVDVFNLDGTPGLAGGSVRLISRGVLDSPWGLAIAPADFTGLRSAGDDPELLVGNFGNGEIFAFDAVNGALVGRLTDPDGEPIRIDGLWALRVGNGGNGGLRNTVYFTAGLFGESHGLFGSLVAVTPGSPEGPAEGQWVQANVDVVEIAQDALLNDIAAGAPAAIIKQDRQALERATEQLAAVQADFAADTD